MEINEKQLEALIRKVISENIGTENSGIVKNVDKKSGVISIKTSTVKPEKFDTGKEGDEVYLKEALSLEESPRLGCGIMEMNKTVFDWTLTYDEIDYIIDGTLEIIIDGRKIIGNKGDIILIPKNTTIQFSVPEFARFMYVTYPADWESQ